MSVGPLEYLVIGFEGNTFDGSIAREVGRVVDQGIDPAGRCRAYCQGC